MSRVKLGVHDMYRINLTTDRIWDVFPISKKSFLAIGRCEMVKFSREGVERRYNFQFSAAVFVPSLKILFCATESNIYAFDVGDLEHPIVKAYETGQSEILKLVYSEDRQILIAVGPVSTTFRVSYVKSSHQLSLTKWNTLQLKCTREMLPHVCYDYRNDTFVNGSDAVSGDITDLLATYCSQSRVLLTSQSNEVCFWNEYMEMVGRIAFGKERIRKLEFLSKHFALAVNTQKVCFIIDVRLQQAFECGKLEQQDIFVVRGDKPIIICITGPNVYIKETVLPYKLWIKTPGIPATVRRCGREKSAARIAVLCKGKPLTLYSTRTRKPLATCKTTQKQNPVSFLYDRNQLAETRHDFENDRHTLHYSSIDDELNRDVVFLPTQGDGISVVTTDEKPQELQRIPIQASYMTVCRQNDQWMYACVSNTGELILIDYKTYEECGRYKLTGKRACGLWYHHKSSSLIVGFANELLRFDLPTRTVIERIAMMDLYECAGLSGNIFVVGCRSGMLRTYCIMQNQTIDVSNQSDDFHTGEVTGLSFGPKYFVSSGKDHHLKFWNYSMNLIYDMEFPFPLLGCEIMNGKRHILISIERAILFINGRDIFGDTVDVYDSKSDNFDMFEDPLDDVLVREEEEDKGDLDSDIEEVSIQPEPVKPIPPPPEPVPREPPEPRPQSRPHLSIPALPKRDCETQTSDEPCDISEHEEPPPPTPPPIVPPLALPTVIAEPEPKKKTKKRPRPLLSSRRKHTQSEDMLISLPRAAPKPAPETSRVRKTTKKPAFPPLPLSARSKPTIIRHPVKQDTPRAQHNTVSAHTLTLSADRFFGPNLAVEPPQSIRSSSPRWQMKLVC